MLSQCSALGEETPSLEAEEVGMGTRWDLDALGMCRVRQSVLTSRMAWESWLLINREKLWFWEGR